MQHPGVSVLCISLVSETLLIGVLAVAGGHLRSELVGSRGAQHGGLHRLFWRIQGTPRAVGRPEQHRSWEQ